MIGKIRAYSTSVNAGYLSFGDRELKFSIMEWMGSVSPANNMVVQFTERGDKAVHVRPLDSKTLLNE